MELIKKHGYLAGITAIGILTRLYHLTAISLWHDEAFSALLIRYPWREMIHRIGLDVHPPMYYIVLRLWHYVFSDSLGSLRGLSVLFGILTIIATYYLIKKLFKSQRAAIIGAVLVSLSPFQIQYVTEARMYTMGAFFAVGTAWCLAQALELQREYYGNLRTQTTSLLQNRRLKKRFIAYYVLFVLSAAIMAYTHYYLLFTAAAIGFYGLLYHFHAYRRSSRKYGWLVLSYICVVLLFLPWLKTFLFQFRQVGTGYWIPPMDRWSIPDTLWRMLVGLNFTPRHFWLVLVTLISVFVLYKFIRRTDTFHKWLVALGLVAPFAGAIMFTLLAKLQGGSSSVYLVRYFLFSSPFYLVIIAVWLEQLRPRKLAYIFFTGLLVLNVYAIFRFWTDIDVISKPGMAAAAAFINKNVEPGHKLYVGSSFEFFNFKYYNRTPARPLLYSGGVTGIHGLPHYAGTAILTDNDLLPDFKAAAKNGDTVWLLWTNGFGASKPRVPANWTQIDEKGFAEVRPYVGTWIIVTEYKVN